MIVEEEVAVVFLVSDLVDLGGKSCNRTKTVVRREILTLLIVAAFIDLLLLYLNKVCFDDPASILTTGDEDTGN